MTAGMERMLTARSELEQQTGVLLELQLTDEQAKLRDVQEELVSTLGQTHFTSATEGLLELKALLLGPNGRGTLVLDDAHNLELARGLSTQELEEREQCPVKSRVAVVKTNLNTPRSAAELQEELEWTRRVEYIRSEKERV